ncbi:MAG: prephenate dehydrogenase [Eggerthellaceae bacterium]|nr:prephenate dehydrogenase [Eggerthellaceae bacterium]
MRLTKDNKILIIGLGIIGGSYAAKLSQAGYHVSAITRTQLSIDYALENDIISQGTTDIDKSLIAEADLIIFALPPIEFLEWVKDYSELIKPPSLVTDVTGVKFPIVEEVQTALSHGVEFIAAHPMAGREVGGVQSADPELFKKANYIVTPTEKNSQEAIDTCIQLGETLGFLHIAVLSPKEHDEIIAYLSMLTHVIAVTLMNANDNPKLPEFTGDSFRELTRIAKINDKMWSELFLINKEALLDCIDSFAAELQEFRTAIAYEDTETLRQKMRSSTSRRQNFEI